MSVAPAGVALTGNTPGPESKYRLAPNRNNQWPSRLQILRKVERFNRTLAAEWAYAKPYASEAERAAAYETWLHHYNHHRPHTGIGGQTPSARVHNLTGKYT